MSAPWQRRGLVLGSAVPRRVSVDPIEVLTES